MLPREIGSIPMDGRRKNGIFDVVGRLLSFSTGVVTMGDLAKLQNVWGYLRTLFLTIKTEIEFKWDIY